MQVKSWDRIEDYTVGGTAKTNPISSNSPCKNTDEIDWQISHPYVIRAIGHGY